jgi:O-antigen ligase
MDNVFSSRNEKIINLFLFGLICYFFAAQAWDQSSTTNAVIGIWLIGLLGITSIRKGFFSKHELLIIVSAILVFLVALLSYSFSPFENLPFKHLEPYTRFLLLPLILLAVRAYNITLEQIRFALILSGISYGIAFIEHTLTGHGRMHGDENPVTFGNGAGLIAACLFFSLFIKQHESHTWRILSIIAGCGALLASIASGTRGTFIAIPFLIIFSLIISNNKKTLLLFTVAAAFIVTVFIVISNQKITERMLNTGYEVSNFVEGNANTPSGKRLAMWEAAVCIFKENPILGSGPNTFRDAENHYKQCNIVINGKNYSAWQAHSVYFNALATLGVIGLASILLFFSLIITNKNNQAFVVSSVIVLAASGITVDLFFKTFTADKYITLIALFTSATQNKK